MCHTAIQSVVKPAGRVSLNYELVVKTPKTEEFDTNIVAKATQIFKDTERGNDLPYNTVFD